MATRTEKNTSRYALRAKAPLYFRVAAVIAIFAAVIAVAIGFYRERSRAAFNLRSEHAQLSTEVVSEVSGYERLETDSGVAKYFIKADHAKTFSDQHLELTNVYIEIYGDEGVVKEKLSSTDALYIPEPEKKFHAYLKGSVNLETNDGLRLKAEDISYSHREESADSVGRVEFERDNVRGRSVGAYASLQSRTLELQSDVEIETFESAELARSNVRYANVKAGNAYFDQPANRIDLTSNVAIDLRSNDRNDTATAAKATLYFSGEQAKTARLRSFELNGNAQIDSVQGTNGSNIRAGFAKYEKAGDRFEFRNGVEGTLRSNGEETALKAAEAVFEQIAGKLALTGSVSVTRGGDSIAGESVVAELFADRKIKTAVIRGSASLTETTADSSRFHITAPELNAEFAENGDIRDANAIGASNAEFVPAVADQYSSVVTNAAGGIGLAFNAGSVLSAMRTDGRTTIKMNAPSGKPGAAHRTITADTVKTTFRPNGRDLQRADAAGNAELVITPVTAAANAFKTTINAPRFECTFAATGNDAENCSAGTGATAVRDPMVAGGRGRQTISADKLLARFAPGTGDLQVLAANGDSKFNEGDRNGIARDMEYTLSEGMVRLRGGEPTVWDNRGRAKASEIDMDLVNDRSWLRRDVSTTYYNRRQIGDTAPFATSSGPIYLTSENAEFDHRSEVALYTGNARGWQDKNYVRGNKIVIDQKQGTFSADGNVQSHLASTKLRRKGTAADTPTSASAGSLVYDRNKRLIQYRSSVDIRQGSDRITAGSADLYLDESNDLVRTVVSERVVITQPKRRASGDWLQYVADNETAILRGNPAIVSDQEKGSTQSGQITLSLGDSKITSEGGDRPSAPGRTRSVYRVSNQKP